MKRVLVVASHYPPTPLVGGVIRIAKLVKYLPSNGWEPLVITSSADNGIESSDELFQQVSGIGSIYRVPSLDVRKPFHRILSIIRRIRSIFIGNKKRPTITKYATENSKIPLASLYIVPDHFALWAMLATVRAVFLVAFQKIDVVYATSPLQSGLIVGYLVNRICGKQLVVEMRDPWTTNPFAIKRAFRILDYIEDAIERKILIAAARIVVINENFIDPILKKHPCVSVEKFSVIQNGFDEDDFKNIEPLHNDRFTIVHAGRFYHGRTALPFLEAFSIAASRHSTIRENWILRLVGSGDEYRSIVDELGISAQVEIIGAVTHKVALQNIISADLLLLVPGDGLSTMTGKIFEYIAAKRPIFTVGNDSAATKMVTSLGIGRVAAPDDIDTMVASLIDIIESIESGNFCYPDLGEVYENYERRGIATKCAAVMDAAVNDAKCRQRVA
jgi:glycosyltransferase involved in cell wall biosynthesis